MLYILAASFNGAISSGELTKKVSHKWPTLRNSTSYGVMYLLIGPDGTSVN